MRSTAFLTRRGFPRLWLRSPARARAWPAGINEATGEPNFVLSANTNAVVLEAMHYIAFGPMLHPSEQPKAKR